MRTTVQVEGYGPCVIEHHPNEIDIRKVECWCGAQLKKGNGWFCQRCSDKLTFDHIHDLNWNQSDKVLFDAAYHEAAKHLAVLAGYGDDARSAAERADDIDSEKYDDVVTGLPAALQELLTGRVVEKPIEAGMSDVYANVFAGLPAELQRALSGE